MYAVYTVELEVSKFEPGRRGFNTKTYAEIHKFGAGFLDQTGFSGPGSGFGLKNV